MAASSSSSASAPATSPIRSWRTAFLTLRDENLSSPPRTTVVQLLGSLIFSQSSTLIAASSALPPHEVTSDVMFLMELARTIFSSGDADLTHTFTQLSHLIYNISSRVSFEINSAAWGLAFESFGAMVETYLGNAGRNSTFLENVAVTVAIKQCLETIRCFLKASQKTSLSEKRDLLNFLLRIVACSQAELVYSSYSSNGHKHGSEFRRRNPGYSDLWEAKTIACTMLGEVFLKLGSFLSAHAWQSTMEVLRKLMDVFASKCLLVEDSSMARYYSSLLNCLHLVLVAPKGSLSDHVAGFVAALRMFLNYGLTNNSQMVLSTTHYEKGHISMKHNLKLEVSNKLNSGPYRPPHMRKKDHRSVHSKNWESSSCSDNECSTVEYASSDSDYSDSDGSVRDAYNICFARARVAAIDCIQDLCRADPKLFTAQWTMLLPSSDVLQPRKYEATLMSCLLFDPYLKARIASASTLATMLDGPAAVPLQVAEYKESSKPGSFTALSSTLGQILMQLHTGILYLIKYETRSSLLATLFKILMLLMSSTPYSRMPVDLLVTVISSLHARIEEGFSFRSDQNSLLAAAIHCLTTALSASRSSLKVKDMLEVEISGGFESQARSGVLHTLFRYCEPATSSSIIIEALQALRAMAHNYPSIVILFWTQVSAVVLGLLRHGSPEVPTRLWRVSVGDTVGAVGEKVLTAAIKLLDDCLRAISGFQGAEDLLDDNFFDSPFTSDCIRTKTISSAPSYEPECVAVTKDESEICWSGREQWCESIEKHMPLILHHSSAMVRAASVTCFAGITSSVFFSLPEEIQHFILTSSINAALNDEVPSVRQAACRAIGILACFPQNLQSAEILYKFIHATKINGCNPLVSVRTTASWALANLCDSLRHCVTAYTSEKQHGDSRTSSALISLLVDTALELTKDNDKIKANAVRALGNLSRYVQCTSQLGCQDIPEDGSRLPPMINGTQLLERMVQAFLSCVATGNVKVQWNVCHAFGNLFLNEEIKLQNMDWAPSIFSILLLLLRDSSNFKIRIQAAAALAVPETITDYGRSFPDIVQGVEHILENLSSSQISTYSNFKYRIALEKQLTSTMLHVLSLASCTDHQRLQDFLVKKAPFLEEWLRSLYSSLEGLDDEHNSVVKQKKEVISKALRSLVVVYEDRNHHIIAQRFEKLFCSMS